MAESFDLVVLGGGCAGLSLVTALAAKGEHCPRTLVIESRAEYSNDRTWCFWRDAAAAVPCPTRHRWQKMRVSNAGQSVVLDCGTTPYQMVAAEDFYAAAQASIRQHPNLSLSLNTAVTGRPMRCNDVWKVHTNAGEVTARCVVDTRAPQLPRLDGATLWQSFYGKEIECRAAVFDPMSLDLMSFLAPDERDVAFVYVLPITSTRALVEVTVFGAMPLPAAELGERLDIALAQRACGNTFSTVRSEHGILPMGLHNTRMSAHPSYVNVGVMAGGARPSTGFAFQRIQRWADECANALVSQACPVGHRPDAWPMRTMDQIFLDVLRANPSRGGEIFYALFSRADPARVIRFLSGEAGVIDSLAVVAAMPVPPFLKVAMGMVLRRGQRREIAAESSA